MIVVCCSSLIESVSCIMEERNKIELYVVELPGRS